MNETDKPPSYKANMGIGSRCILALDSLAGRFKNLRELWSSDWGISPVRDALHTRRYFILASIQE